MKILALNVPTLDLSFYTNKGLNLEVEYQPLNMKFDLRSTMIKKNSLGQEVELFTPNVYDYLNNTYKENKYSIILLGWNPNDYDNKAKNTGGYTYWLRTNAGATIATVRLDAGVNNYCVHEIMHCLVEIVQQKLKHYGAFDVMDSTMVNGVQMFYYKDTQRDAPDSNHNQTWNNIKQFLPELNAITYNPMYKYFSQKEVDTYKLKPELWAILDKMREIALTPFFITSGLRTPDENIKAGGKPNSAHLRGLACDLAIKDNFALTKMLNGIMEVRKTTPFFLEIALKHLHLDLDSSIHDLSQTIISNDD